MTFKNKKVVTTAIMTALVLGLILLPPTTMMPIANGQMVNKTWTSPQQVPAKHVSFNATLAAEEEALRKAGYVATPIGYLPHQCVFDIGNNAHVNEDQSIDLENGTHFKLPSCSFNKTSTLPQPSSSQNYVVYATAYYNPPTPPAISYYSGQWTVPPAPTTQSTQTLFLWIGLTPTDTAVVPLLQPVLVWGYDGQYWEIASWFCSVNGGSCSHSTLYQTSPGSTITGTLTGSSCNGGTGVCNWNVQTGDGVHTTAYGYSPTSTAFYYMYGGVLEAYNVNAVCTKYPAEGTTGTAFSSLSAKNTSGYSINPSWTGTVNFYDGCNEGVNAGYYPAENILYYGPN